MQVNNLNTTESKNGGTMTGERDKTQVIDSSVAEEVTQSNLQGQFQNTSALAQGNSHTTNAATAILQNNGLRKSLQSSSTGLRQMHTTAQNSNYIQQQQQMQQTLQHKKQIPQQQQQLNQFQPFIGSSQSRTSHSHNTNNQLANNNHNFNNQVLQTGANVYLNQQNISAGNQLVSHLSQSNNGAIQTATPVINGPSTSILNQTAYRTNHQLNGAGIVGIGNNSNSLQIQQNSNVSQQITLANTVTSSGTTMSPSAIFQQNQLYNQGNQTCSSLPQPSNQNTFNNFSNSQNTAQTSDSTQFQGNLAQSIIGNNLINLQQNENQIKQFQNQSLNHNINIGRQQFSTNIQQQSNTNNQNTGLFPKIGNFRGEGLTLPNSAHSINNISNQQSLNLSQATTTTQIAAMQQQIQLTLQQQAQNNVFKNNGGHISGMSNHHGHTYNLNERREREKTSDAVGNFQLKPLSSP